MAWAMILHDNEEMLLFLQGAISDALKGTECSVARNVDEASRILKRKGHADCKLIVASLTVRLDASHAPGVERRELTGLDFVRSLRTDDPETPPALLVASFIDTERVAQVSQVPNTRLLSAQDLFVNLAREVRAAANWGLTAPKYRVDLDIVLRAGQKCSWRMKGSGGIAIEDTAVMDISDAELDSLKELSQPAGAGNPQFLRRLGLSVYKVLMADSLKSGDLEVKLNNSVSSFGGLSVARIRFNVDHSTHCIHLETLAKPQVQNGNPEFWMLKTPMFRKFGDRGGRYPLFKDRASQTGSVHCLLIQGKVSPFAVGAPFTKGYPALKGAKEEIDWLEEYLASREPKIGELKVLRHADFPRGEFADAIRQALATGRFGLVHYSGHSELEETSGRAYLLLGGDEHDVLAIDEFSAWAGSVQFVFLSSCQSASSQFIMKLVETEVPAVAGFAWPVLDDVALNFSQAFYESLFGKDRDNRYLEYSFMRAKQHLHRTYPANAHWVAPLLFMQVFDTQSVGAEV